MIPFLVSKLRHPALQAWHIRHGKKTSYQSFLAKDAVECRRTVETETAVITVYRRNRQGLGFSSFKVTPVTMDDVEKKLEEALFAASLVNNQPFELPEKARVYPDVRLSDAAVQPSLLPSLENRIRRCVSAEKQIRLSAAEFFIDRIETRLLNSKGIDVSQEETRLHTEFILLAKGADRENEFINRYARRFVDDFDLEGEIAASARQAREATQATLPQTGSFPVLLTDEPLDHLFNPLIARASARLKYNKMIESDIGRSVLEKESTSGDPITVWSDPLLKGGGASYRFDGYGTPAQALCLVENNRVKNFVADKRYADYLNVPVTGEMGNTRVAPGKKSLADLSCPGALGPVLYRLTAFSAFEPNAITGAFSAEIRAGYEISAHGTRPIKGGSVSGVLQRDLVNAHFSSDLQQRETYHGPQGILFPSLTIAGK